MNSVHDLGGMMGFGAIENDSTGPNFHAEWEERVFALTLAVGATGTWNIDESRHTRESLPPVQYLSAGYYQIWLAALERLIVAKKLVDQQELDKGQSSGAYASLRVLKADRVLPAMMAGSPYNRPVSDAAMFAVGDAVCATNINPQHHTRIPRYGRGKTGVIEGVHGSHVFPDSNAQGQGENPQWLYKVKFTARELWGAEHSARDLIYVDLWEPYLEQ